MGMWFFRKSAGGGASFTDSYWLSLDGTGDYATAADHASLDIERTDVFTIMAWIRPTVVTGFPAIISKGVVGGAGYHFGIGDPTSTKLGFQLRNSPTNRIKIGGTAALSVNTKYLVGVTYDGSSTAAGTKLWINGVHDVTATTSTDNLNDSTVETGTFYIGESAFFPAQDEEFTGKIGDVAKFNKVLSSDEWLEAYNSGTAIDLTTHSAAANLVTPYYLMGDPSGSGTISSVVGAANDLTLVGNAAIAAAP